MTPRQFCQEQLLLLGEEELLPAAQAASLDILHSTIMSDPDGPAFEARLRLLAAATEQDGARIAASSRVARVLLDEWLTASSS